MFEDKELLTVKETAEYLRVCDRTVYKLIEEKQLLQLKCVENCLSPKA